MYNRLAPIPPTPRTNSLRAKIAESTNNLPLTEEVYDALALAETLERELQIASSGWSMSEKDNVHLSTDNSKLRRMLDDVRRVINRV